MKLLRAPFTHRHQCPYILTSNKTLTRSFLLAKLLDERGQIVGQWCVFFFRISLLLLIHQDSKVGFAGIEIGLLAPRAKRVPKLASCGTVRLSRAAPALRVAAARAVTQGPESYHTPCKKRNPTLMTFQITLSIITKLNYTRFDIVL